MRNMMIRKTLLGAFSVSLALFNAETAQAILVAFDPGEVLVGVGAPVEVALTISGLGDFEAPSLGAFDLDVSFDPMVLELDSVSYGDPVVGDQLDILGLGFPLSITTPFVGGVNLFELSFNTVSELNLLQTGSFTLARLSFITRMAGTSSLDISILALADAEGAPLSADAASGRISAISAVGEPGTLVLLAVALGAASRVGLRSRRRATPRAGW